MHYWTFAIFIGTAMSITAFPVLARILNEKSIMQCEIGVIALGAGKGWILFYVGYAALWSNFVVFLFYC